MPNTDGTCEYVLDPDDPETWGGEEGDECYVEEKLLNEDGVWTCPHNRREGKDRCVFHLPIEEKSRGEAANAFVDIINDVTVEEDIYSIAGKFHTLEISTALSKIELEKAEINISHAYIDGNLDWSELLFNIECLNLNGVTVSGESRFKNTVFRNKVNIQGAVLGKDTKFVEVDTEGPTLVMPNDNNTPVSFQGAEFEEFVDFSESEFKGHTHFDSSMFENKTEFSNTQFYGSVTFTGAKIHQFSGYRMSVEYDVSFSESQFEEDASFHGAEFGRKSYFSQVDFGGETDFYWVNLGEDTSFTQTDFRGDADFLHTNFGKDTDFSKSIFYQEADFQAANFKKYANFSQTEFLDTVIFESVDISTADFSKSDLTDADFTNSNLTNVDFESALLSRATLFDADLRGAKISGSLLGDVRINDDTKFLGHPSQDSDTSPHTFSAIRSQPTCVYDPDYPEDNEHEDVDKAKSVYRALEELGGKHARPRLQARSFVRRQDLQKKDYWDDATADDASLEERFIAGLRWSRAKVARATLLYGESPWRVIACSLGIIFSFALLYPLGGWMKPADGDPITYSQIASNPVEILNSVYYSTLTYTALGFGDFKPVGFGRALTTIETALGAVLIALLVFVLGRRAAR